MNKNTFNLNIPILGRVKECLEWLENEDLKGKILLDVGSSFGWLENEILKRHKVGILGIEPSRDAIDFAQKHVKGAKFLLGDALNLPVKDKSVDIVLLFDVLEHIPRGTEDKCLIEVKRVLKKGGKLLLSTPHDSLLINLLDPAWYFGHRHYSIERIKDLTRDAGLKIETMEIKGDIRSSIYLIWFYVAKLITGNNSPRSDFFEDLEGAGYEKGKVGTIFLTARK